MSAIQLDILTPPTYRNVLTSLQGTRWRKNGIAPRYGKFFPPFYLPDCKGDADVTCMGISRFMISLADLEKSGISGSWGIFALATANKIEEHFEFSTRTWKGKC